ncbi:TetR/AcrR family transcriptional regulator [Metabacillus sp. RGM 3146]|uniref:TetR/AcrR family transcriptional regulator n=1 Tax=Metabacillus sp. RGM 3146 TaxID=3401092 RepID=UPI003BA1AD2B
MTQIKKAAFTLFSQYGVQKVNIHDIAKKANVSQVTIYNYFGSKEALLLDVLKTFFEEQMHFYNELLEKNISFKEKIEHLMKNKIEVANSLNDNLYDYILHDEGEIKNLVIQYESKHSIPFFQKFIELGKKEGVIHKDLSLETVMFFINSFTNEAYKHPEFIMNYDTRNQVTKELLQMFFYGLAGESGG